MTVTGSRFGSGLSFLLGVEVGIADWTLASRLGPTACEATNWVSDSAVVSKIGLGFTQSLGFQITVGRKTGTMTNAISYDQPFVTETVVRDPLQDVFLVSSSNFPVLPAQVVTVTAGSLVPHDISPSLRLHSTATESSAWVSDTSLIGLHAAGVSLSLRMIVTAGVAAATVTEGVTYDAAVLMASLAANVASAGSLMTTTRGDGMGVFAFSDIGRLGLTASESSAWVSDTSLHCLYSHGLTGSQIVLVTAIAQTSTLSEAVSYNQPTLILTEPGAQKASRNLNPQLEDSVSIIGQNLGVSAVSVALRTGGTSCPSTEWNSDTALVARASTGSGVILGILTAGSSAGSLSKAFTYDAPVTSSLTPGNAMASGSALLSPLSARGSGTGRFSGRSSRTGCHG